MFKISYDSNNKDDCELIEDYYFLKYYTKSIVSDWKNFYDENINLKTEDEIFQIIYNHLNKTEYKRLNTVYRKFGIFYFNTGEYNIIRVILKDRKEFIKRCKCRLVSFYGEF